MRQTSSIVRSTRNSREKPRRKGNANANKRSKRRHSEKLTKICSLSKNAFAKKSSKRKSALKNTPARRTS